MIRYVNAAHLHSHSPSCFLAGCWGSPSLCPPPPSPPLSPLPLAHIFWNGAADAACVWVCVPAQGCSLRYCRCYHLVELRAEISRWETGALLGTTYRCNHVVSRSLLQLSDTCKWDLDLTMVPFLWTSFETTGGGKRGKLRMSVSIFWKKNHFAQVLSVSSEVGFLSFSTWHCIFWNIKFLVGTFSFCEGLTEGEKEKEKKRNWNWSKLGFLHCCLRLP